MSVEHTVEVESIDDFRGKDFDFLDLLHKDCNHGRVEIEEGYRNPKLFCSGCYSLIAVPSPSKLREIIDLALHGDKDSEVVYKRENKDKIVRFILASSE